MRGGLDAEIAIVFPKLDIGVELHARPGDRIGVVGANGAGKTSVLRAIAGLEPIDRGRIAIGGTVVDDPAAGVFVEPRHRCVGFMFQDVRLFPHLSALDNAAFGLRARGIDRRAARARATEWLERLDLGDHLDQLPVALSGGQSQRVALARVLVTEPQVLLLDEPLAAIDPAARGRIRDDLASRLDGFGGVTVVVSHDHADVRTLANRALVLDAGRVVWAGPAATIPNPGKSADLPDQR
jgi:molybdate transport system ATP-binding protein